MAIDDLIAQRTKSTTPEAVICLTSPASPLVMPESMAIPERILTKVRDYFKGSFESGTWFTSSPDAACQTRKDRGNGTRLLDGLIEQCVAACKLFADNHFQEAGQVLITATSAIKDIVLEENPETLRHLFGLIVWLLQQRRYEIALSILRQISALAKILLGLEHPLHCICEWLAFIHASDPRNVISICIASICGHFESLVGPMHLSTLTSRRKFICEFDVEMETDYKIRALRGLLETCEATLGSLDNRTIETRLSLGLHYMFNQYYAEAIKIGQDIVADAQLLEVSNDRKLFKSEGLRLVAISQHDLGDAYSAVVNLREAIDSYISVYGSHNARARFWLMDLERWLIELRQLDSAVKVHERWRSLVSESSD